MQTDNSAADPWDHSEAPPSPSVLFVECKLRKAIQNDERQAEPGTDGFIDDEFKNYLIFDGASRGARELSPFYITTSFWLPIVIGFDGITPLIIFLKFMDLYGSRIRINVDKHMRVNLNSLPAFQIDAWDPVTARES